MTAVKPATPGKQLPGKVGTAQPVVPLERGGRKGRLGEVTPKQMVSPEGRRFGSNWVFLASENSPTHRPETEGHLMAESYTKLHPQIPEEGEQKYSQKYTTAK